MQKIAFILLFFSLLVLQKTTFPQILRQLDSLCVLCNRATSDSEKVDRLGKLATYYYIFKQNDKADSVLNEQLLVAQLSNNNNVILNALFGNAVLNIISAVDKKSFDNALAFIDKGISYANANNEYNYLALGYARKSDLYRKYGQVNESLANANYAITTLESVTSDSVRAVCYISLGDIYLEKEDPVTACRSYNNAFDIALKLNSVMLQSRIYHCFSNMYCSKLHDTLQGLEELNKSYALNKLSENKEGLLMDYYDLARITNEKYFIEQSIALSDSLKNYGSLLNSKRLMLVYYFVVKQDAEAALAFLNSEPELKQSYVNSGPGNYLQLIANIYFYTGQADRALPFYKRASEEILTTNDLQSLMISWQQVGDCYFVLNKTDSAITYYRKALSITDEIDDPNLRQQLTMSLSNSFNRKKDFKNAYSYLQESLRLKEKLQKSSSPSDLTLLKVERENKKHELELQLLEKMENNKRNLQYMAITVAIVIVFFIMLVVGSFSISKTTVRLFGYFFFISLFEFIVLLIDNLFLTHATHNQPLKIWLIKIGLIGLLAPFQHFLETNMIGLLASKKLIEARTKFSLSKSWKKIVKPSPKEEEGLEKDTAVM